jgi:hypothetical protein
MDSSEFKTRHPNSCLKKKRKLNPEPEEPEPPPEPSTVQDD